jgi:hypothetical protein
VKGKVYPRTGHEGTDGEYRYSSTLSLTSELDGDGLVNAMPKPLYRRERFRYPWYRRLSGPQDAENLVPTGFTYI